MRLPRSRCAAGLWTAAWLMACGNGGTGAGNPVDAADGAGGADASAGGADGAGPLGGARDQGPSGGGGGGGAAGSGGGDGGQDAGQGGRADAAGGAAGTPTLDASAGGADAGGGAADQGAGGADAYSPDAGPEACEADESCPAGTYCDPESRCAPGCRGADDPCPRDARGHLQICDAATHACVPQAACCTGASTCTVLREEACDGLALEGSFDCAAEPCGPECLSDRECERGRYCHPVDFRCTLGCRIGDPAACPFDESCLPDTRICGALACAAHGDCLDPSQYCDFLGANATRTCREGCRDDASCRGGGRCAADHTCVLLCDVENDQCPVREACDGATGRCVPLCESHDDCPADQICDALTARCAPGCRDDAFEPDDIRAEARPLEFSPPDADGVRHASAEGRLCVLNPDLFVIDLPPGGRFHARVDFEPGAVTYLALNTDEMDFGGERPFESSPAEVSFPPLGSPFPAGPVYLTLVSESEAGSDYTVTVDLAFGDAVCFPDAREPGDGVPRGAARLPAGEGSVDGSICNADEDWFVMRLGRFDGFALSLVSLTGGAPLVAEMYRASRIGGLPGAAPDYTTGEGEPGLDGMSFGLAVPSDSGGFSDEDWYIRVRGADAGGLAEYRLFYAHQRSGVRCGDDQHTEPNDDPGSAIDLDVQPGISADLRLVPDIDHRVPMDLSLCPGDTDVFCLIADRDDNLAAWLVTESGAGVQWLDGFGDPLTALMPGTPPGATVVPNRTGRVAAGRFCARVAGSAGPYELWVRRSVPAMFACAADTDETDPELGHRNDTAAEATAVPAPGADPQRFAIDTGYLCDVGGAPDADWYRFTIEPRQGRLCIRIGGFAPSGGDVDAELYLAGSDPEALPCATDEECPEDGSRCVEGACLLPTATAATQADFELFTRGRFTEPPGTGTHYLRVGRGEPPGEGVPYRVEVSHTPESELCGPDGPERVAPNDTPETASNLGDGDAALCETWICPEERVVGDYYAVAVPAGEDRTVLIDYDDANEGRLFLYGTGPQSDPEDGLSGFVRSELGVGGQQCLNLRGGDADGVAVLQVTADRMFGSRVDYALRVVRTDLRVHLAGECEALGGPPLPACPPRAEWQAFPGIGHLQPDGCWADLPLP